MIGAGPIGLLIALVARQEGARVVLSEVSPERLELARELGFETIDPRGASATLDAIAAAGGADVVFEAPAHPPEHWR